MQLVLENGADVNARWVWGALSAFESYYAALRACFLRGLVFSDEVNNMVELLFKHGLKDEDEDKELLEAFHAKDFGRLERLLLPW